MVIMVTMVTEVQDVILLIGVDNFDDVNNLEQFDIAQIGYFLCNFK